MLGKEHSGRVRGLGFGPSPSQVFGTTSQFNGISLSSNNINSSNVECQQKVQILEERLETSNQRVQSLEMQVQNFQGAMAYIFTNFVGNVPPEFAVMLNAMVC